MELNAYLQCFVIFIIRQLKIFGSWEEILSQKTYEVSGDSFTNTRRGSNDSHLSHAVAKVEYSEAGTSNIFCCNPLIVTIGIKVKVVWRVHQHSNMSPDLWQKSDIKAWLS